MNVLEGIVKILSDFKSMRAKNSRIVLGSSPEMDYLFENFCNSAMASLNSFQKNSESFSVIDSTQLEKGCRLEPVVICRSDVIMMLDNADSKGFKLFGRHKDKPGQFGIVFTKKGIMALNRKGDEPGRRGGFISWEGFRFCRALLVDQRRSERFDYDTDFYPGKFVFMCYDCGLKTDELYECVMKKIEELLGCNDDWVVAVKSWQ